MKTNRPRLIFEINGVTKEEVAYYVARGRYLRAKFLHRLLVQFWRNTIVRLKGTGQPHHKPKGKIRQCQAQGKLWCSISNFWQAR